MPDSIGSARARIVRGVVLLTVLLPVACTTPPVCDRRFLLDDVPTAEVVLREEAHETRPAILVDGERILQISNDCPGRLRFAVPAAHEPSMPLNISVRPTGKSWRRVEARKTRSESPGWNEYEVEDPIDPAAEVRFSVGASPQDEVAPVWLADPTLEPTGTTAQTLVIVVLIDTLRFDRVSRGDDAAPMSPRLAALAEEGVSFQRAYSTSSWTRPAVASLFTSLAPDEHRVRTRSDRLADTLTTWAEVARQNGMQTVAVATNPNVLPLWGFAQGFGRFIDLGAREWQSKSDAFDVFSAAEEILKRESRPLFLYLHLMDPHNPYDPPLDSMRALYPDYVESSDAREPDPSDPTSVQQAKRQYDGEVRNADAALGDFVDKLRERGDFASSTLLVVSDHGEEFLDHGGIYHGQTLFEEQIHIPMVLKAPENRFAGTRVEGIVSIIDAMPTVADLLGWTTPSGMRGQSMVEAISDGDKARDFAFASLDTPQRDLWAAVGDETKLIATHARRGENTSVVFDVVADPDETHGLDDPELETALRDRLDARVSEGRAGWHLKLCGGAEDATVEIKVEGATADAGLLDLEEDDSVRQQGSSINFTARLETRAILTEFLGTRRKKKKRDEDGIWFEGDRPAVHVSTERGARFHVLAGGAGKLVKRRRFQLDPDAWTTSGLEAPTCSGKRRATELLIWRIEPHTTGETAAADDRLRERLRALGYVE